eukprot:12935618-Prorocentrum_lima.AAC.1
MTEHVEGVHHLVQRAARLPKVRGAALDWAVSEGDAQATSGLSSPTLPHNTLDASLLLLLWLWHGDF